VTTAAGVGAGVVAGLVAVVVTGSEPRMNGDQSSMV